MSAGMLGAARVARAVARRRLVVCGPCSAASARIGGPPWKTPPCHADGWGRGRNWLSLHDRADVAPPPIGQDRPVPDASRPCTVTVPRTTTSRPKVTSPGDDEALARHQRRRPRREARLEVADEPCRRPGRSRRPRLLAFGRELDAVVLAQGIGVRAQREHVVGRAAKPPRRTAPPTRGTSTPFSETSTTPANPLASQPSGRDSSSWKSPTGVGIPRRYIADYTKCCSPTRRGSDTAALHEEDIRIPTLST